MHWIGWACICAAVQPVSAEPVASQRWARALPADAGPRAVVAAERELTAALRVAGLPPGIAATVGCTDRRLWVQLQAVEAAALSQVDAAVSRILGDAVGSRPRRADRLGLAAVEGLLIDLDRVDSAGQALPSSAGRWVGGGALGVHVDGMPLLSVRLVAAGADPAQAARLDGTGPDGIAAALRARGLGAWSRGATLRADGLLLVWADLLPEHAPAGIAAIEGAVDAALRSLPSAADVDEAALRASVHAARGAVEPVGGPRAASGRRLLLIGDLDAAPVDIRARADWPAQRPTLDGWSAALGDVAGLGCGGHAPLFPPRTRPAVSRHPAAPPG